MEFKGEFNHLFYVINQYITVEMLIGNKIL